MDVWILQIEKRICRVTEERRGRGEDRPPPPKITLSGPKLFGFTTEKVPTASHTSPAPRSVASSFNVGFANHDE